MSVTNSQLMQAVELHFEGLLPFWEHCELSYADVLKTLTHVPELDLPEFEKWLIASRLLNWRLASGSRVWCGDISASAFVESAHTSKLPEHYQADGLAIDCWLSAHALDCKVVATSCWATARFIAGTSPCVSQSDVPV